MGIAAEQSGVKCQNCKKSIAMLFPNSSCDCVGGIFFPKITNQSKIFTLLANCKLQLKISRVMNVLQVASPSVSSWRWLNWWSRTDQLVSSVNSTRWINIALNSFQNNTINLRRLVIVCFFVERLTPTSERQRYSFFGSASDSSFYSAFLNSSKTAMNTVQIPYHSKLSSNSSGGNEQLI